MSKNSEIKIDNLIFIGTDVYTSNKTKRDYYSARFMLGSEVIKFDVDDSAFGGLNVLVPQTKVSATFELSGDRYNHDKPKLTLISSAKA